VEYKRFIELSVDAQDESEANESFQHAEIQIARAMGPFGIEVVRHYEAPGISVAVAIENAVNSIGCGRD